MKAWRLERFFYLLARGVGDVNAAQHGRFGRRLVRRAERRAIGRLLRKVGL